MARAVRCAIAALALLSCQRDPDGPLSAAVGRHPVLARASVPMGPERKPQLQGPLFPESLAPVSYLRKQDRLSRLEPFGLAERASTHAATTLPARADGALEIEEPSGLSVRVSLVSARETPAEAAGAFVVYPAAFQGGAVLMRALDDGAEDFVELPTRPAQALVEYEVELSDEVAGLRLVADTLELLDARGDPRLRMSPPVLRGARGRTLQAAVSVEGCALDESSVAPWGRPVVAPGARRCQVRISWEAGDDFYPAVLDPVWTTTGDLAVGRFGHSMVKLASVGLMLTCGGYDVAVTAMAGCELYNEVTGTWAATGAMPRARANFDMAYATPPSPGVRAVAVGGENASGEVPAIDLYNPATGTWSFGANMPFGRSFLTATALPFDNNVIVILGGQYDGGGCAARSTNILNYRFSTNTAVLVGNLATGRALHQATPMPAGALVGGILVTGGSGTCCGGCVGGVAGAEVINGNGLSAFAVGSMLRAGRLSAATYALPTGQVRIAGGLIDTATCQTWADSELYTPSVGFGDFKQFPGGLQAGGWGGFGVLSDGRLLVTGGGDNTAASFSTGRTFVFDGTSWAADGALSAARRGMATGTTPNGKVMVAGGGDTPVSGLTVYRRTELFGLNANGTPCTGTGLCASKLCVDGVCCNTACAGSCDTCNVAGSVGTCTFSPPTTVCNPSAGMCDPAENCTGSSAACPADALKPANTAVCRPEAGLCDVSELCNGSSPACPADVLRPQGSVCNAYVCSGADAGCPTACGNDAGCAPNAACQNYIYVGVLPPGSGCLADAECSTGFCSDGACCDTRCDGACDACNLPGWVGTCTVSSSGNPGAPSCAPYGCDGVVSSCPTGCATAADCASGFLCVGGLCASPASNGNGCETDAECQSGFCTDGVCCSARCGGACDSCNLAGSVGSCAFSPAGSTGEPSCNPFACNGASASCPTACIQNEDCHPTAFCPNGRCVDRTRGHIGFGCGAAGGGASALLALLGVMLFAVGRRRAGSWR
ncbi:MAG: hypothetical protein ACYC8T_08075 [Myxococcaceae bacterium]